MVGRAGNGIFHFNQAEMGAGAPILTLKDGENITARLIKYCRRYGVARYATIFRQRDRLSDLIFSPASALYVVAGAGSLYRSVAEAGRR